MGSGGRSAGLNLRANTRPCSSPPGADAAVVITHVTGWAAGMHAWCQDQHVAHMNYAWLIMGCAWCRTGLFRSPLDADTALKALIAANVAVWVGWRADPFFMQRHFTVSLQHMRMGYYHTLVTSCFSHRDPMHLAVNMIT